MISSALVALQAEADPVRAASAAAYHKVDRCYLGVPVPRITELANGWRVVTTLDQRLELAATLWQTNIHEARVAAAKLLTQARIKPADDAVWSLIQSWVPVVLSRSFAVFKQV